MDGPAANGPIANPSIFNSTTAWPRAWPCWSAIAAHQALRTMHTITASRPAAAPAGIASYLPNVGAYFACLAAYNNGRLHGAWVDLEEATSAEEIQEAIDYVLATSPEPGAEEWAMHDSAGLPACLSGTEWPGLEELATYAAALGELDTDDEREAFRLHCDDLGQVVEVESFRDAYQGRHDSGEDYAQQLAEDTGAIPEGLGWPCTCIDWEQAWRELTYDGCSSEPAAAGGVHIFRSC
jgi:antirestriction protein